MKKSSNKNFHTPDDVKFIQNVIRRGTIKWSGRAECLRRARKKVFVRKSLKGTAIYKYHWQCANCKAWYRNEKDVEVDHIVEIGSYNGDWDEYIRRAFCGQDNLQVLCKKCHLIKTGLYNNARLRWKRKQRNVK